VTTPRRTPDRGAPEPGATGRLAGRTVLLGVTGSIAAYKAVDLLRRLAAEGATVQVLMTEAATRFVGPLTFETLSRRPVVRDPLALLPDQRIAHIATAEAADAIVVAPATARWMSAMAHGLADDIITITCLAARAPVVVAPAMDAGMYSHPATRANAQTLREFGYRIVEPEVGTLASGLEGRGRLADQAAIVDAVVEAVSAGATQAEADEPVRAQTHAPIREQAGSRDLEGLRVLVTAGGTAEPLDPVRYIGNRSSGRMGIAVAEAALARGAAVTLVLGTSSVPPPPGATVVSATTAAAMRDAVFAAVGDADVLVMAAAVADFRPRRVASSKLERGEPLTLDLEPTEDILAGVAARLGQGQGASRRPHPVLVGFAAETGSLARAAEKAHRKGVDLLVANDVLEPGSGFEVETNRVTLIVPGRDPEPWPLQSKRAVAERLLDRIATLVAGRERTGTEAASDGQRRSNEDPA
jgi:phosphopantothenoylcysteine decarboxylase / phosphopantothenate---cysteine ligase